MLQLNAKHLLTGQELAPAEVLSVLTLAKELKQTRNQGKPRPYLAGKHLALLFSKPSLRTRFSFTVAMRELGGDVIESIADTRKTEEPEDQARVLAGYCHGVMVRTHEDENLKRMSLYSPVPIINGLSDLHHPCQILSDLFTLQEIFGELTDLKLSYVGDGNNILHSLLLIAPLMGINVHYCCPSTRMPNSQILQQAQNQNKIGSITAHKIPEAAVAQTNVVYTDVWASMGFEDKAEDHVFNGFQVNEALMAQAHANAIFMHCLPMQRGKEVSTSLPEQSYSVIFQQSENRLHLQKALLLGLLMKGA